MLQPTHNFAKLQVYEEINRMTKELVRAARLFKITTKPEADDALSLQFEEYLHRPQEPPNSMTPLAFWDQASCNSGLFLLARTAWLILQIPASEAAAERAFGVVQALFPRIRMSASQDLLNAELRIRLEQIYSRSSIPEFKRWLDERGMQMPKGLSAPVP
jgi:hypothetical protein